MPKLFRRQFFLGFFLLCVTALVISVAWYLKRVSDQRQCVDWLKSKGASVSYDFELDQDGNPVSEPNPPVSKSVVDVLGVDFISTVVRVRVDLENVSDISRLKTLQSLEYVEIVGRKKLDLRRLTALSKIKHLYINGAQIENFKEISKLQNLESLILVETGVTDLMPLRRCPNLRYVGAADVPMLQIKRFEDAMPGCKVNF